jgi:hypothetical protein
MLMKKPSSLHWEAFEYEPRNRSNDWFWAVGIITVAIAVTAIIFNNVLFGLVVILGGFVLSLYAARPPHKFDVVIDDLGIRVDKVFYPYRTLESFWVEEHHHIPKILIKSQRLVMPFIGIPLDVEEVSPEEINSFLSQHLPEIFHGETIFEKLIERLGF